jgi:polyisoprenoid-binding protein YceI
VTLLSSDDAGRSEGPSEVALLGDRVEALHADVRALAQAMGTSLSELHATLSASQDEFARDLTTRLDALRGEVASRTPSPSLDRLDDLLLEVAALGARLGTAPAPDSAVQPAPTPPEPVAFEQAETAPPPLPPEVVAEPAPTPEPKARKSFLAFTLPSDDLRFDERRAWTLLPSLSRVGFDAKTTLHDFTAATSGLEGSLEAELSRPAHEPRARIVARAGGLESGDEGRDEEMHGRLAVQTHPTLEFELTAFEPEEVDAAAQRARGTARGRLTIRGITQEVAMPVRLALDEARRLSVEGEMELDLTRFEVPVPNKLGLITMEKDVQVWIALKFRANPRSEN